MPFSNPQDALRHHVSGAIERGEGVAIVGQPVLWFPVWYIDGVLSHMPGDPDFDRAYETYCANPMGFTSDQLGGADWRGVMTWAEIDRAMGSL